jgi:hypothetical protein
VVKLRINSLQLVLVNICIMKSNVKSKMYKYTNGTLIRCKQGIVSSVCISTSLYVERTTNYEVVELVIDKTRHHVWSIVRDKMVRVS